MGRARVQHRRHLQTRVGDRLDTWLYYDHLVDSDRFQRCLQLVATSRDHASGIYQLGESAISSAPGGCASADLSKEASLASRADSRQASLRA